MNTAKSSFGFELKKTLVERLLDDEFLKSLYKSTLFHEVVTDLTSKEQRKELDEIVEKIYNFNTKEKIEKCFPKVKKNSMFHYDFHRIFEKKIGVRALRAVVKIHSNEFANPKDIPKTKKQIIRWIYDSLFGETNELAKRNIENQNLQKSKEKKIQFFHFFNKSVVVPLDIILQIFQFIKKDYSGFCSVATINENWYLTFLQAWDWIEINEKNIYSIPLLILHSSKTVIFENHRSICNKDFEYILENVESVKKFHFRSKPLDYRFFKFWKTKKRKILENCEEFVLDYYNFNLMKYKALEIPMDLLPEIKTMRITKPMDLFNDSDGKSQINLANNLKKLKHLKMDSFFRDTFFEFFKFPETLDSLELNFFPGPKLVDSIFKSFKYLKKLKMKFSQNTQLNESIKKFEEFIVNKPSRLEELCFSFQGIEEMFYSENVLHVMESFKNIINKIQRINLTFTLGAHRIGMKRSDPLFLNIKEDDITKIIQSILQSSSFSNIEKLIFSVDLEFSHSNLKYIIDLDHKKYSFLEYCRIEKQKLQNFFKKIFNTFQNKQRIQQEIEFNRFEI